MFLIFRLYSLLSCLYIYLNLNRYNNYLFFYCLSLFWRTIFITDWSTNLQERFSYSNNILFSKFSDRLIANIGEFSLIYYYIIKLNKPELIILICGAEFIAWLSLLKFESWYQYSIEYNLWSFIYFIISIEYFKFNYFKKFIIYFFISIIMYITNIIELYNRNPKKQKESMLINFINSLKTNNVSKLWTDWKDNLSWMISIFFGGTLIVIFVENN